MRNESNSHLHEWFNHVYQPWWSYLKKNQSSLIPLVSGRKCWPFRPFRYLRLPFRISGGFQDTLQQIAVRPELTGNLWGTHPFFWNFGAFLIPGIFSGSGIIDDIDDEWIEMISFNSLSSSWNLWIYSPWKRSMGIPWFLKKVLHSSTHELIFLPQPYTRSARESSNARYQIHWR